MPLNINSTDIYLYLASSDTSVNSGIGTPWWRHYMIHSLYILSTLLSLCMYRAQARVSHIEDIFLASQHGLLSRLQGLAILKQLNNYAHLISTTIYFFERAIKPHLDHKQFLSIYGKTNEVEIWSKDVYIRHHAKRCA